MLKKYCRTFSLILIVTSIYGQPGPGGGGFTGNMSIEIDSLCAWSPSWNSNNSRMDFGTISIGDTSQCRLFIENQDSSVLLISNIRFNTMGDTLRDYSTDKDTLLIQPDHQDTLTVYFHPDTGDFYNGRIWFDTSDSLHEQHYTGVQGIGLSDEREIVVQIGNGPTDTVRFHHTTLGDSSDYESVFISNLGTTELEIYDITATEHFYVNFSSDTLDTLENIEVEIRFYPSVSGEYFGTLNIFSNDSDEGEVVIPLYAFAEPLSNIYHVSTTGSDETGDGSEENPFATIQQGVDVANDMDTVYVSNGVYEGGIVISNKAISLIGESREQTKIIQPISSPQISIVDCQTGTTRVENFIIKRGSSYYGGGIYTSGSIVEINSVDFSYNSSSSHGAAINSIESTVKVQNSTFSHNESNYLGGAIYVDPLTTCEIYNSSFDNNEALWGGAIATVGGGKLLVEGCNISFNTALGNNPNPNEDYPTFGGGGGIYHEWSDSLEIYDSEITNNTAATGAGGGIAVYLSNDVTIDNIVLSDNSSSGPNYPSGGGGVAFYRADNVLFENSTIANNVSNHNSGGGIFLGSESGQASIVVHATFNRLTIVNNSALSGGAIFCWSAILNLYHSTLAQNEASNIEWSGGGLASHYVTEPNIISSLFYDNTPNSIHNGYPYTPVLVAYSLVQEQWVGAGNLTNVDPLFCDPDSGDYSLAENSPCVGAGEGGSNMGAYEIGCDPIILSTSSELLPVTYTLHQNYPNPFNPVTRLRYDLAENSLVNITIYDMMGRQVKTLINQTQDAGYRSIVWNATNDYGKPVSAGIYLYQIQAGKYISTKKMVLLK